MDADNKNEASQDQTGIPPANQGNDKLTQQLAEIAQMLANQNAQFEAMNRATQAAAKPPVKEEDPDPTYDPKGYKTRILNEAEEIARRTITRERELNSAVYSMSQEYPEISTDGSLKKDITDILKTLPEVLRDTAAGYETAILKAVHKSGLLPKSKRQPALDEDVSMGSGRSTSSEGTPRKGGKAKLSDETVMFAELLGRDVNDPKVREGLEKAAQRTKWNRYE